jgi:glucose/arabinose dehydrogenase
MMFLMHGVLVLAMAQVVAPQPQPQPEAPQAPVTASSEVSQFTVRPGYEVSVAVQHLPGARMMEFDVRGTLHVSRPQRGDILSLRDADGDGVYETRQTFVSGFPSVHAMCFRPPTQQGTPGVLWFATSGSIHRAIDKDADGVADEVEDVIPPGSLPRDGGHWWRSLLVTDTAIYTSIGDSGNISDQTETERQKIWKFNLDGSGKMLFASGLRNTEELRLRPGTEEIWGVDHGTDWFGRRLGDEPGSQPFTDVNPPDEINWYREGGFYGHPFLTGNRVPRPEYWDRSDLKDLAAGTVIPEWNLPAHWAANAFTFVVEPARRGAGAMPEDHIGDLMVACRGSWNSTEPVGYCVARVLFDDLTGKPYGMLPIVQMLKQPEQVPLARPVDCVQAPDGSILFSSDQPGRVYRIRWVGTDVPK